MSNRSEYLGARIRMYRKAKGLSLQDFSAKLFKSVSTVSKYETGDIIVNIDTLYEIAAVLSIPVTELLSFPGDRTAQSVMICPVSTSSLAHPLGFFGTSLIYSNEVNVLNPMLAYAIFLL